MASRGYTEGIVGEQNQFVFWMLLAERIF